MRQLIICHWNTTIGIFTSFEFASRHYRRGGRLLAAFLSVLLVFTALGVISGCTRTETEEIKEARKMMSKADPKAAQQRAEREAEFQEVVKDPLLTPVEDPATSEKAPPEVGYGQKSEVQILRENEREARIGVLAPLTGDLQEFGLEASNGAELASDEFAAKGGIKNKDFELLVFDTKGKIKGAQMGVEAFLDRRVLAVVGAATGEVSFSANKAINESQLIMISAGSRRRLGDTGPYNFRNTLNDVEAAKELIEYAEREKGYKKFAIFSSLVNDYSVQLSALFKGEIINRNLELTHELFLWNSGTTYMTEEDTSISGQLKKLKGNMPDALIYSGDGMEGKMLVSEMRELGFDIPLLGAEDLMIPEFTELKEKGAGTIVYGGFNPNSDDPKVKEFVRKYKERFGETPGRLAALSYDAYHMLAEAINNAKSLRPSHVRQALLSIKDFKGVTGMTSINKDGEAVKRAYIFELRGLDNGEYDFVCVKEAG